MENLALNSFNPEPGISSALGLTDPFAQEQPLLKTHSQLYPAISLENLSFSPLALSPPLEQATREILGTAGRDILVGTAENERFVGGQGADLITGGLGNDVFVYQSIRDAGDTLTDFELGKDKIDLTLVLESFGYTGFAPLKDGYVQLSFSRGGSAISLDSDGKGPLTARPYIYLETVQPTQLSPQDLLPNSGEPPTITASLVNDTGTSNSDRLSYDPTIGGQIASSSNLTSVKAQLNSTSVEILSLIQADGQFILNSAQLAQINGGSLADGQYTLKLTAQDVQGNASPVYSYSFTLDKTAPNLSLGLDPNFDSAPVGDLKTTFETVTLGGTTEANLSVFLGGESATANGLGEFSFSNQSLLLGINVFSLSATDLAGNVRILSQTIERLPLQSNQAPTDLSLTPDSLAENKGNNSVVGLLSTLDSDAADTHTYTLVSGGGDTDNSAFEVVGNELRIKQSPDFETQSSYSIRIRTTDQGELFIEKIVTVAIADVNESPTNILLSSDRVEENAEGAVIGTLSVTDPDTLAAFLNNTVTINDNRFEIVNNNGIFQLKLKDSESLDFETEPKVILTLLATDASDPSLTVSQDFLISVIDIDESISDILAELAENREAISAALENTNIFIEQAQNGVSAAIDELETIVANEEIPFTGNAFGSFGLPDPSIRTGNEVLSNENNGIDNRLTWGRPRSGSFSSFIQFEGANFDPFSGNNFSLGELTYGNGQTLGSTAFDGDFPFELTLELSAPVAETETFDFIFDILNTPNNTGNLVLDGDRLRFSVSGTTKKFFEFNNQDYTLSILGFSSDNGETITSEFNGPEDAITTASLFARITEGIDPTLGGLDENAPRPATPILTQFDEELAASLNSVDNAFENLEAAKNSLEQALEEIDLAIEQGNEALSQEDLFNLLDAIDRLEVAQQKASEELEKVKDAQNNLSELDTNLKTVAAQFENFVTNIPSSNNNFEFASSEQPFLGIIDTGFNGDNLDLRYSQIILGRDYIDGDNNPLIVSGEGNEHGTHLLGVIAAIENNNIGIDGINDDAPIWVSRAVGSGQWAKALVEFVDAAVASGQPNAIVTLGFDLIQKNPDGSIETRFELTEEEIAALDYARKNGVLIVVAAGNEGSRISALGQASQWFDNIITVGAVNEQARASYSSFGDGLDILATGGTNVNPVYSTVGDLTGTMRGTSVATAEVAGAASLVWAANPDLSYRQIIDILKNTAEDINEPGTDPETGAGVLVLDRAVETARITLPQTAPTEPPLLSIIPEFNAATAIPLERPAFLGPLLTYLGLALTAWAIFDGVARAVSTISNTVEANDLDSQADELIESANNDPDPVSRSEKLEQAQDLIEQSERLREEIKEEIKSTAVEFVIDLTLKKFKIIERVLDVFSDAASNIFRKVTDGKPGVKAGLDDVTALGNLTPGSAEKILYGERIPNPNSPGGISNEIRGAHSPRIKDSPDYDVEVIRENADGTTEVKLIKGLPDGKVSKIKTSTLAPDSWSDQKIIDITNEVSKLPSTSVRSSDGASKHRAVIDGVMWEVIKDSSGNITSSYPTGGIPTPEFI